MNTERTCGCKGCRTCLVCENQYGINQKNYHQLLKNFNSYIFCPSCNQIYPGWDITSVLSTHPHHNQIQGITFPGILIHLNFLKPLEGITLINQLDEIPWDSSQSGRRKQNFGPKTNFRKRKLRNGDFHGFPEFTKFIQQRFHDIDILKGFQTIEQCSLEYDSQKGASIDPHIDDCWIWGERIVTVNCLGDSVLTLSQYKGNLNKFNLDLIPNYSKHLKYNNQLQTEKELQEFNDVVIRVPMPNLSLIVLYGAARYQYEHCVLREDIHDRRVCLAYREFTPMYLNGGEKYDEGIIITKNATNFWDHKHQIM